MQPRHFMSVVVAATLWGTGGLLGTLLAERSDVPPASVAMWRMLIAGVVLTAWLAARRSVGLRRLDRAAVVRIVATGALTAVFEVLYFTGIALAGVGLSTLVTIGSAPVWVALWDWWRHRDRPDGRRVLALVLALGGLALLLGSSLSAGDRALLGVGVALVAGASFAGVTVVNRTPVPGLGAARLTALSFTAGGLLLVPVALVLGWGAPSGAASWGIAAALGIGSTALAYLAYLSGLATVPPFVATIVSLLEPLVAAVLGALVLAERLGWSGVAGGAVLASAVVLLRPQRDEPESIH
ncbi:EamA family transporter [Demequina sp. SYSU T00192]|uniref:EamA family transporter n=1 Tax=Demequina litoralis TaxID=3051660 RepID=A0ABT8G6Y6_9MICO|nr:EamA family transporter [Demequina sp. SYSU T00192]MDN4474895.1 EamA family transporter [Demequina sp. SYSU T00192]